MNSFYSKEELKKIGFKAVGNNVLVSKKCSIYGAQYISIGNNVRIDDFCILSGRIQFGNNIHIAAGVMLFGGEYGIVLEDYVGISSRCAVYAVNDDYSGEALTNPTIPEKYRNVTGGTVIFEKHSLVGSGCTVLPDVTVKEGTSIGSMSLVNKTLDEWGIYLGIPCRRVKDRSKHLLELEKEMINLSNQ
ncbi:acyltransferase [Floccifex sp.]|uniref:acyltransferase n=1 Tax=Floccifex sp. TaxID=2815810 RepID=UPI003F0F104B